MSPSRRCPGNLTDHYDPRDRVLRLSQGVARSDSLAALGVAAHETGHAIQHAKGYAPMKIRSAVVPAASFGSSLGPMIFFMGLIFSSFQTADDRRHHAVHRRRHLPDRDAAGGVRRLIAGP